MLTLNGKRFAENENEFIDSLFHAGGTCVGYARKNKLSIVLLDHNKARVGVINRHGVLCRADKRDGAYWYCYGDIDIIGRYESYIQQVNEGADAIRSL